jgi:hypothetical protein
MERKFTPMQNLFTSLDNMPSDQRAILYTFKNRFSFMYRKTHLANLRHLNPSLVIFNFERVFLND